MTIKGYWENVGAEWEFFFASELPKLPTTAVCGIHFSEKRILLTKNHRGWDITGGHIEIGETIVEALHREMLEEGGVQVSDQKLIGYQIVRYPENMLNKATNNPYPTISLIPFFSVETDQPLQPVCAEECTDAQFFAFESKEVQHDRFAGLLQAIIDQHS